MSFRRSIRIAGKPAMRFATLLRVELLEQRQLLAADLSISEIPAEPFFDYTPVIVAGDTSGSSADSPSQREIKDHSYSGVGSLFMTKGGPNGYICTGTLIADDYVLTAGHCLDSNNDGLPDFKPENVSFRTTDFVNGSHRYVDSSAATALYIHPDFTGFDGWTVNDDIAMIKLATPITTADAYDYDGKSNAATIVASSQQIAMVGYGESGDGVDGYYVSPSLAVKRLGYNTIDGTGSDDENTGSKEVYYADFDGRSGNGPSGGPSLGNQLETTLGGGDSGGPAFARYSNTNTIVAINTFTYSGGGYAKAPLFGSGLGGILVHPYAGWIDAVLNGTIGGGGGGGDTGGGGGGKGGGGKGGGKPRSTELGLGVSEMLPPVSVTTQSIALRDTATREDQEYGNLVLIRTSTLTLHHLTAHPQIKNSTEWLPNESLTSESSFSQPDEPQSEIELEALDWVFQEWPL